MMNRIISKLDNFKKLFEEILKNQAVMKKEITAIKGDVAILSYDPEALDVSRVLKFEYFVNIRNINNVL